MPQRFTIEDIEVQDCSGVIFRAADSKSGETVAVRRFFPFGPTGGGLTADEQDEYASALEHLEAINHPSLRSIVSGGCDPVDGIPFIATEWVEGVSLRHILAERSLSRAEVTALLVHALEACEVLSAVLGREGVWIETDPQTIIVGADQTHRPITFWISPLRWLGQLSGQRGMEPLVVLTETAMGWSGEPPESHGVSGLAGWLEWLRQADRNTSLAEARKRLTATVGRESGPASHRPAQQATHAKHPDVKMGNPKKSMAAVWILACCILTAAGLTGWILNQKSQRRIVEASGRLTPPAPHSKAVASQASAPPDSHPQPHNPNASVSPPPGGERTAEQASRHAAEATARIQMEEEKRRARSVRISERGGVLTLEDRDVILEMKGSWVTFEATLMNTRFSSSGKTLYLEFSQTDSTNEPRGVVSKDDLIGELTPDFFQQLTGKKIRIRGEAKKFKNRPEIAIKRAGDVEVVP